MTSSLIDELVAGYLFSISLFTFVLFGIDKFNARHHRRRLPETCLLWFSFLGGSPGALAAIYLFRHKTRHLKFTLGIPALLIFQVTILLFAYRG